MRPVNLFLAEDGVLKLGYYGITTQAECYSIKNWKCDGVRSFAPEVFRGEYEMKSDVWFLGTTLIEMMGITPYVESENGCLPPNDDVLVHSVNVEDIQSAQLAHFLKKCFRREYKRSSVKQLMTVNGMGWRMMSSIRL